eukprot:gene1510-1902_t
MTKLVIVLLLSCLLVNVFIISSVDATISITERRRHNRNHYHHYSFNDDDYYTAAVVDYSPIFYKYGLNITKETAVEYMMGNVKNYQIYSETAASKGAQIIVFPEYGILGDFFHTRDQALFYLEAIPDPPLCDYPIIPCGNSTFDDRPVLQTLSCIAISNSIVVIVDMGDVQYCNSTTPNCPSDGRFQFNTQVAFDSNGQLIAKYHKSHLFAEPLFDQPAVPDPVVFQALDGVSFGMMVCFDILWQQPQTDLLEKYGIANLVYSTEWVNTIYAYAISIQQSWSFTTQSNVLASNIGLFSLTSGSGIYSNGDVLASYANPTMRPGNMMLISELPKNPRTTARRKDSTPIIINDIDIPVKGQLKPSKKIGLLNLVGNDPNQLNATIVPFLTQPYYPQTVTSENNGLKCTFNYQISNTQQPRQLFILGSYNGMVQNYFHTQLCFVSICQNNSMNQCSSLSFNSTTTFSSFSFTSNIDDSYHIIPQVSSSPMANYLTGYELNSNTISVQNFNSNLVAAGLFGIDWNSN